MEIIYKKPSELTPYKNNPRDNDGAVDYVMRSIDSFGFKVPIVIDADGVVVCGHTRLKAAKKLHLEKVPCIVANDLTDDQIKAFRLADNKVSEQAAWNDDLLIPELKDLELTGFDMADFGFDIPDFDDKDDADEEEKENARVKTLDGYNLRQYSPGRTAGFYQMPMLLSESGMPDDLIGFNYMLTTKPKKGLGVHFYVDDYQFERVWNNPEEYCERLAAFDYVLTPDFLLYMEMPMAMKIWNVYRSRLIGQILQDMGVKVIPTLSWAESSTFSFCFDGIDPGGVVSVSTIGVKRSDDAKDVWTQGMDEAIRRLKPSAVLVYGGDIGYKFPCKTKYFSNSVTERMKEIGKKTD